MPQTLSPEQRQSVWRALRSPRLLKTEVLAGLVVGLALIPEAIAFSLIVGVDPKVGLFASFIMACSIAFLGGRPAMISASTAATALVIAPVMATHGLDYLIATVMLAGVFQVALGLVGVARLLRFIPRSVMIGFVNALAILVFVAQIPDLLGVPWLVYPLVALGLLITYGLPRLTTAVPSPLVAIVVVTAIALIFKVQVPNVGDKGELPDSLPAFFVPQIEWSVDTFAYIAPFALGMAVVGLLESLMTAKLVDDISDTRSSKKRESVAQGCGNIFSGFFGAMGGCAVIGQTMINVKGGGARTRLSTFMAGIFVLLFSVVLGGVVAQIPMAALVAVMIYISLGTFNWHSILPRTLRIMPKSETFVMVASVAGTVATHNLAVGVVVGVVCAAVLFAQRVSHLVRVERVVSGPAVSGPAVSGSGVSGPGTIGSDAPAAGLADSAPATGVATYTVTGELFFASSNDLYMQFLYHDDPSRIVIDVSASHLWDASTIAALDSIKDKYERYGKSVEVVGLNEASAKMQARLGGKLGGA
ncbi:SulP family inorganic anion transporter [Micrococcales bacterium 31B]|nr:SulP family inorganic anion transporter [Micrococcales bacterium 31B]